MKTIIAGSRGIVPPPLRFTRQQLLWVIEAVEESGFHISEVISGTAKGIDSAGEEWAAGNDVLLTRFPADWSKFGRSAGFRRNEEMGNYGEAAVLVWDGVSRGTRHMYEVMQRTGKPVYVKKVEKSS